MTADSRSPATPIAIRVTRPYATEDEYLEHELDTLTRASITLVGAQPRAEGMVLRFEVVLPNGQVLIRGEGRVVGYKANAHQGAGGLSLRFTRLDTRSKTLVDKAAVLRERRRPSIRPSGASEPPIASMPPAPRGSIPPSLRASVPPSRPSGTRTPPPLPVMTAGAVEGRMSSLPPPLPAAARMAPLTAARSIAPTAMGLTPTSTGLAPEPMGIAPEPLAPDLVERQPEPQAVAVEAPRVPTSPPPRMPTPVPPRMPAPVPAYGGTPPAFDPSLAPAAPPAAGDVDRDRLLERLRERARHLDPAFLAYVLDRNRPSS